MACHAQVRVGWQFQGEGVDHWSTVEFDIPDFISNEAIALLAYRELAQLAGAGLSEQMEGRTDLVPVEANIWQIWCD